MNENVKIDCCCDQGYDKGVIKKTVENNIFTIYGNITKNNCIVLRYHGELMDSINCQNYSNNLYISYFFDNNSVETIHMPLAKCSKCVGESYCSLIDLGCHDNIAFEFYVLNEAEKKCSKEPTHIFNFQIKNDPISDILEKYNVEENSMLPAVSSAKEIELKKVIGIIKKMIMSLFNRKKDVA